MDIVSSLNKNDDIWPDIVALSHCKSTIDISHIEGSTLKVAQLPGATDFFVKVVKIPDSGPLGKCFNLHYFKFEGRAIAHVMGK